MTLRQITLSVEIPTGSGAEIIPPTEFRLIKGPLFETTKGTFIFDKQGADSVMAAYAYWGIQLSGDYEHQSLNPLLTGPIPASFWGDLQVRPGEVPDTFELWAANVQWTPTADKAIRNREYRHFSPTIYYDSNLRVTELLNVALTNLPATLHQAPLAASRRRGHMPPDQAETTPQSEPLALANVPPPDPLLVLCNVGSHAEALPLVAAWRTSHEALPAIQAELATLRAQVVDGQKKAMVAQLRTDGKSTPNQEPFLMGLSLEQLTSYAATAPVIRPRTEAVEPHIPPPAAVQGSAHWAGLSLEQLAKSKDFDMLNQLALENPSLYRQLQSFKKSQKAG